MNSRELLQKLISFPTVSSVSNKDLIAFAAAYLKEQGATITIIPGKEAGKECLLARLGPDTAGGVMLAGHVDVVPTEGQPWTTDPFAMTEKDGNLYGRGACDMKGFVACAMALAEKIKGQKLSKPLYIGMTHDEETGMDGAQNLRDFMKEKNIRPEWVWLGEPTEMEIVNQHKGLCVYHVKITGHAAHSSLPAKGVSAIMAAADIAGWVKKMAAGRAASPIEGSPFDPPYTTFNVGQFNGGKAHNIIADSCDLVWEYRLHPGDDGEMINKSYEEFLNQTIRPTLAAFPQTGVETMRETPHAPFSPVADNPGEKILCPMTGSGHPLAVPYLTEAEFYQEVGCPVIICGPGSITKAHQPDEYVPLQDMDKCDLLLMETLKKSGYFG